MCDHRCLERRESVGVCVEVAYLRDSITAHLEQSQMFGSWEPDRRSNIGAGRVLNEYCVRIARWKNPQIGNMRASSCLLAVARAVGAQRGPVDHEERSWLFEHVFDYRIACQDARDGLVIAGRARGDVVAQTAGRAGDQICARCGLGGRRNMDGLCGETGLCGHRQQHGCRETGYGSVHEQTLPGLGPHPASAVRDESTPVILWAYAPIATNYEECAQNVRRYGEGLGGSGPVADQSFNAARRS
jgi:hypothetical protein